MNEWKPAKTYRGKSDPSKTVDLWMHINASPMSMGWADSFRVVDCWRQDGKWVHYHEGKVAELAKHYVTHWMPSPKPPKNDAG